MTSSELATPIQAATFISVWVRACLTIVACLSVLNLLVDPYLLFDVPRVAGFNARKSAAAKQERMMKAYDVVRYRPKSIILGSSRVDIGLDARHFAWPEELRPTYNLGLGGADLYMSYRYLQHVLSQRQVELVVVGLDFEYFLSSSRSGRPVGELPAAARGYESRLAVAEDGSPNRSLHRQYALDLLRTLSLSGTRDSMATVFSTLTTRGADIVAGSLELDYGTALKHSHFAYFARLDLLWARSFQDIARTAGISRSVLSRLERVIELCQSHRARVIVLINPVHADLLELYGMTGLWPLFEDWKRELTTVVRRHAAPGNPDGIILWDFSGYDRLSSQSIAATHPLQGYPDPAHYNRTVGDAIIDRIFGHGDEQFGVVLTPENLEAHLQTVREQQRVYRELQPADVQRLRRLHQLALMSDAKPD
jgi:hypothetical protein